MTSEDNASLEKDIRETRKYVFEIVQRLARLEEKTSRTATLYGLLGGSISGIIAIAYLFIKLV